MIRSNQKIQKILKKSYQKKIKFSQLSRRTLTLLLKITQMKKVITYKAQTYHSQRRIFSLFTHFIHFPLIASLTLSFLENPRIKTLSVILEICGRQEDVRHSTQDSCLVCSGCFLAQFKSMQRFNKKETLSLQHLEVLTHSNFSD